MRRAACALLLVVAALAASRAGAQGQAWAPDTQRVEAVRIVEVEPVADALAADALREKVSRAFRIFPASRFDTFALEVALDRVRRLPGIAAAQIEVTPGIAGGVEIEVQIVPGTTPGAAGPRGLFAGEGRSALPVLFHDSDTYLTLALRGAANLNANYQAWYRRGDVLLDGNPLVNGAPGDGWFNERSAYLEPGIYGIVPLSRPLYVYAGLSYLWSGSNGQDLFANNTRSYAATEDAYLGLVAGDTSEQGDRWVFNLSAGRKKFSVADGFIVGATSGSGGERGMINFSPRWAAEQLVLLQAQRNQTRVELFHIDPDELVEIDTDSIYEGINFEHAWSQRVRLGLMYLHVPRSRQRYFTATEVFGREGLNVYNLRLESMRLAGETGAFMRGEYAEQHNDDFAMHATGAWLQGGWQFGQSRWTPVLSYRFAHLSGDDPDSDTYERWDPLLMAISPWDWVQGMNHGKVFGNANRNSHRLQLELRPLPTVQWISQAWVFRADEYNNLGGLAPLSELQSKDLGHEINSMVRWFFHPNAFFQAQAALTWQGDALELGVDSTDGPWFFANAFVRWNF